MIDALLSVRITFILGITNLIALALVALSCRCILGSKTMRKLQKYSWYKKFYKMHCYYWWFLFVSVFFHSVFAILAFGFPL